MVLWQHTRSGSRHSSGGAVERERRGAKSVAESEMVVVGESQILTPNFHACGRQRFVRLPRRSPTPWRQGFQDVSGIQFQEWLGISQEFGFQASVVATVETSTSAISVLITILGHLLVVKVQL